MTAVMAVLLGAYSPWCRADAKNLKITRFDINGRDSSFVVNTCDKTATLSVRAEATVDVTSGHHTYSHQLLKDGVNVGSDPGWFVVPEKKDGFSLTPFMISVPAASGKYH